MTSIPYRLPHRAVIIAALLALLALSACGDQIRFRPVFGSPGGYVPPLNNGWSYGGGSRS
jgi:hypothetical protein